MTDDAKKAAAAYRREWNRRNKDKVREYRERYWNRVAERAAAAEQAGGDSHE